MVKQVVIDACDASLIIIVSRRTNKLYRNQTIDFPLNVRTHYPTSLPYLGEPVPVLWDSDAGHELAAAFVMSDQVRCLGTMGDRGLALIWNVELEA